MDKFAGFEPLGEGKAYVDRIFSIIERIRLFEDFERTDIERLAGYMQCYRAPVGTEIIREGDAGDFMVLLIEGRIEVLRRNARGLPQRMAVDGPGKTFGEMSLIDGAPRFASCVAIEPVLFAVLDRDALIRMVTDEPTLGVKILMELLILLNQRLRNISSELMRCVDNQRLRIR